MCFLYKYRFGLPRAIAGHRPYFLASGSCACSGGGLWCCMVMAVWTQAWLSIIRNTAHTKTQRILTKHVMTCSLAGYVSVGGASEKPWMRWYQINTL